MLERLYLQRLDDQKVWEEVDDYVFKNYTKVVLPDGGRRYTDNRIWVRDGRCGMVLDGVEQVDLGLVMRFLGVSVNQNATGFLRKPDAVKLKFPQNRTILHEIGGANFKLVA